MIVKLKYENIITILKNNPEQIIFDEKTDFKFGDNDDKKSEIIKDIVAIANGTTTEPGYIFYGVDSKQKNPLLPKEIKFDDAKIQQLVKGKIEPEILFLFYEVKHDNGIAGVLHIEPSSYKPHIIIKDFGKLREGQILIRKGSSTSGIRWQDLINIMYSPENPAFASILRQLGNLPDFLREYRQNQSQLRDEIKDLEAEGREIVGL